MCGSRYRNAALRGYPDGGVPTVLREGSAFGKASASAAHDLWDRVAVDIREPHVAPVVEVGELGVIHSQQVQNRGVQIVNGDGLLLRLVAEFIARADGLSALDLRTRHPHAHGAGIMVAAHAALRNGHPPEFAVPYNQR